MHHALLCTGGWISPTTYVHVTCLPVFDDAFGQHVCRLSCKRLTL